MLKHHPWPDMYTIYHVLNGVLLHRETYSSTIQSFTGFPIKI